MRNELPPWWRQFLPALDLRMRAHRLVWLPALAFAVFHLAACHMSVHVPKSAFSVVSKARADGFEIETAFNTAVMHRLGITWSVSGTYLPGSGANAPKDDGQRFFYQYRSASAFELSVHGPSYCKPSLGAQRKLSEALDAVLAEADGWPAQGTVSIKLTGTGKAVKRYALSANLGKLYRLDYVIPCLVSQGDEALWFAAMVGIHESTHAALTLARHQPRAKDERERVAIGSEACLLLALSGSSANFFERYPSLIGQISNSYQISDQAISPTILCEDWRRYVKRELM
jgi:hypothetical protein